MLFLLRHTVQIMDVYIVLVAISLLAYAYVMFIQSISQKFELIWIRSIELLLLNFILVMIAIFFGKNKKKIFIKLLSVIPMIFILILGSIAYSFGTASQIIYAMSGSLIFVVASFVVFNFIFSKITNNRLIHVLSGLIIAIFVYQLIVNAYEHPYRLIDNIEEQNQKVSLLGTMYVDTKTKQYITDLQKISNIHRIKDEEISLIDMTGGSPGANVILGAGIFGTPWLLGAYKGSDKFVERILQPYIGTDKLKNAWILTTPKGARKLDLNILNKISLNFPNDYKIIGTVRTAHRNELQEVWKPINTLK